MNKIKRFFNEIETNNYYSFIILFLVALVLYIPSLKNLNFFWDDEKFVYLNPKFMNSPSWTYFWNIKSDMFKVWPFGYTFFWMIIKSFPEKSFIIFKIINIFLHSLNVFLVFKLLNRFKIKYAYLLSLLCLIHPLNVESVSWMFQLLTILAFTLFACSLHLIVSYLEGMKKRKIFLAFIFFALSLLTKGIALLSPFFFLALFLGKKMWKQALWLIPFFALSFFLGVLTQKGTEDLSKLDHSTTSAFFNDLFGLSKKEITPIKKPIINEEYVNFIFAIDKKPDTIVFNKLEVFSQALIHYPLKLIAPYPLHFLYKSQTIHWIFTILILLIAATIALIFYKKTRDKKIFALGAYFAIFLLPYMGVTFITFFYWSNVSDRYTYFIIPAYAFFIGLILKYWDKKHAEHILTGYVLILVLLNVTHGLKFNNLFALYTDTFEQKKHPVTYSLLFEQYYYRMDLQNSEKVLLEGVKAFPTDPLLKNDLFRLESLRKFYNQKGN